MKHWPAILGVALLTGCARFQPQPIVPDQNAARWQGRSLTNAPLKIFLEKNLHREIPDWPHPTYDFDMLTLAAFYYHPSLEVARAQWHVAQAGIKTAGAHPNPTLAITPGYSLNPPPMTTPWFPTISLDVPIETAGKRGKRISQAEHLSEAARFNVATAAWQVRSGVRASLIEQTAAEERSALLQKQVELQASIAKAFEQQAEAGAIAKSATTTIHVALQKARLDAANAQSDLAAARSHEAEAIGVPLAALNDTGLSFDALKDFISPTNRMSAEARDVALHRRSDILSALAEYAASEDALRLEIAKQYPDVHLNPGYQFDQGEHKWTLGLSMELPMFNRNQGPIAEAKARREEAAAKFNAVQSAALAEIDRALAAYQITESNLPALQALAEDSEKQRSSAEAQSKAGALERLDFLNAQLEAVTADLVLADGRMKLQQATAALEDAMQWPLNGAVFSAETSPTEPENKK